MHQKCTKNANIVKLLRSCYQAPPTVKNRWPGAESRRGIESEISLKYQQQPRGTRSPGLGLQAWVTSSQTDSERPLSLTPQQLEYFTLLCVGRRRPYLKTEINWSVIHVSGTLIQSNLKHESKILFLPFLAYANAKQFLDRLSFPHSLNSPLFIPQNNISVGCLNRSWILLMFETRRILIPFLWSYLVELRHLNVKCYFR